MPDKVQNQVITDIARDLVAHMAPQELPLLRATSEAYFKNPAKTLKGESARDDTLGFGTGSEVILLTPVVLAVTSQVVDFLTQEVIKSIKAESPAVIGAMVRALFKKFRVTDKGDKDTKVPPLTSEQLKRVRTVAFNRAIQLKLPRTQAELLADSLLGSLAMP